MAVESAGEKLQIRVLGLATIAADVTPELALATIESITVLGALHASPAVKAALAERIRLTRSTTKDPMNSRFQRLMAEATRLTRAGDLHAATAAIQAALGGGAAAPRRAIRRST